MRHLLGHLCKKFIRHGILTLKMADGTVFVCGDGQGSAIEVRFLTAGAERRVLLDPGLALGEVYMDGQMVVENATIADVLAVILGQPELAPCWSRLWRWIRYRLRTLHAPNKRSRSKRNVKQHYDLNEHLYSLFLDADRQYSCAYWDDSASDLEGAQLSKKRHLAAKLILRPGQRILDIGCGWGGLSLYLAEMAEVFVTGVTLSQEQFSASRSRAVKVKHKRPPIFLMQDYRDIRGTFDRIVSVGMFEHVGRDFYPVFFRKCCDLLSEDGVMVLHSIGRSGVPEVTNPWIAKYIFPGGYIPSLSEVLPVIERSGLLVCDIEILRLHYAETIKCWRERFATHRTEVVLLYGDRFARMWEFYLGASEMAFRNQNMMNFQIQLAKRQGIVPMTRNYIHQEEVGLRTKEGIGQGNLQIAAGQRI
jgi:cyclopropane-fatty-acyl-phospholipid synthase